MILEALDGSEQVEGGDVGLFMFLYAWSTTDTTDHEGHEVPLYFKIGFWNFFLLTLRLNEKAYT